MERTTLLIQIAILIIIAIVSIKHGYLTAVKRSSALGFSDRIIIKVARHIQGEKAAKELQNMYHNPKRRIWNGRFEIFMGIACLIVAVFSFIVYLKTA